MLITDQGRPKILLKPGISSTLMGLLGTPASFWTAKSWLDSIWIAIHQLLKLEKKKACTITNSQVGGAAIPKLPPHAEKPYHILI